MFTQLTKNQGLTMPDKKTALEQELVTLFDLKNSKLRESKKLTEDAMEAQKDIRLLSHMFRDDIPDVTIPLSRNEWLKWDSKDQKLLFIDENQIQILDSAPRETMIRIRPYLSLLVKQAREFLSGLSDRLKFDF
jgi:hypothetical protein